MQADRVRRAAAGHERRSLRPRLDQLAGEMQHEHVDAVVGGEQVRAEPDRRDLELPFSRSREDLLELLHRSRLRIGAGRTAGADRRQARELDSLLEDG